MRDDQTQSITASICRAGGAHSSGRFEGREQLRWLKLAEGQAALIRTYRHGGFFRHCTGTIYCSWPPRPFRELAITEEIRRRGIPTVETYGAVMLFTGWFVLDALISMAIVLIIAFGALRLLREAGHILLEGVPRHLDLNRVLARMQAVEGVNDIHHLHVWSICSHITALSAHIDVLPEHRRRQGEIVGALEQLLEHDFHITHTTLQADCANCLAGPVIQQLQHRPRRSAPPEGLGHAH